jgi:hypothetical protein
MIDSIDVFRGSRHWTSHRLGLWSTPTDRFGEREMRAGLAPPAGARGTAIALVPARTP